MIKYILLGFLNYQSMTGYELKETIDTSTAHFWHAHHSQIYTTLHKLEQDGLVTSQYVYEEGQPARRVYTLTDPGRADLRAWLDQPLKAASPVKEELLVRLFFSGQRDPQQVLAELAEQRELHRQTLQAYQALTVIEQHKHHAPYMQREAVFWQATLDMGIRYEEMYLAWLEDTVATLEQFAAG